MSDDKRNEECPYAIIWDEREPIDLIYCKLIVIYSQCKPRKVLPKLHASQRLRKNVGRVNNPGSVYDVEAPVQLRYENECGSGSLVSMRAKPWIS